MRKRLPIREGILGLGGGPFHISISKAKLREIDRVPPGAWEGGWFSSGQGNIVLSKH